MFSRTDLERREAALRELPHVPVDEVYLEEVGWEVSALLVRGDRAKFQDALHFWVNAVRVAEGRGNLWGWGVTVCEPLTEDRFGQLANGCWSGGWCRLSLVPRSPFVSALTVRSAPEDIGAVAMFDSEYVAVFWSTTA